MSLQLVVEKFKWVEDIANPSVGFFSQISRSPVPIFSHPNKDKSNLVCPGFNYHEVPIDPIRHLSWFPQQGTNTHHCMHALTQTA